jgi:integrase
MIYRPNYDDVQAFLVYHREVMQHDEQTVHRYWVSLRALLEWADATPFPQCKPRRPLFPTYVVTPSERAGERTWSHAHMDRILKDSRAFLNWCKREYPLRYKLQQSWIDSLRLPRAVTEKQERKTVIAWTLEEVMTIAALQVDRLALQRDKAAIVFLFLSGMRIGAFCTLPINCVNIAARRIEQFPSRGVRTKNRKVATTTLLPIPALLSIVEEWDRHVRSELPDACLWFPRIDEARQQLVETPIGTLSGRRGAVVEGIKALCKQAGLAYKSPHKLRHGHAQYGIQHAKTIEGLKAISQNLMHSNLSTTDGIYGNLTAENINATIASLANENAPSPTGAAPTSNDALTTLQAVLQLLKQDPDLLKRLLG